MEGLCKEVTHLSSGGEGMSHGGVWGMGTSGGGKRRCKGPEVGNVPGMSEGLGVAGADGTRRRVRDNGVTGIMRWRQIIEGFYGEDFGFYTE